MKGFILAILVLLTSCDFECHEKDPTFRPHKVRHCNKSKIYYYYHNTSCDCPGIKEDLCEDCNFQKTYRNWVEYYDTGERIIGR